VVLRLYHWLYWLLVLTSKFISVSMMNVHLLSQLWKSCKKPMNSLSREITSLPILECIQEVDEDFFSDGHYFELVSESLPSQMNDIECVCCKTYCNGACFVTFYFEGGFYVILLDTENEQALLDVSMPDITQGGEGITLKLYDRQKACSNESLDAISWKRLSLWQTIGVPIENELNEASTLSLSSSCYGQSYIILKPNKPDPSKGQNIEHAATLKNFVDFLQSLFDITAADIVECSVIGCSKRLQVVVCLCSGMLNMSHVSTTNFSILPFGFDCLNKIKSK
jgi:hypothetical protein